MIEWKTIKIPADDYERHNTKRQNLNETWAEYINGQAPESSVDLDIESALNETLNAKKADIPDASEIAREVARQLDYAAIADRTSEQVVRELQG